jgi:uncharacterized protein YutE (UPF0331/DUF86 family)
MSDVIIQQIASLQRCVSRAREEYQADPDGFATNFTRQDAALLNVLRACETAIDLANHVIRVYKLGVPTSSADSFRVLCVAGVIDARLSERMRKMVGFRNTVIHQYTEVEIEIVRAVIVSELDELLLFGDRIREYVRNASSRYVSAFQ